MAYQKQTFEDNTTILKASHMTHIEDGIVAVETTATEAKSTADTAKTTADTAKSTAEQAKSTAEQACPKSQAATTELLGLVKQSANVAKAAGPDNVTKAEFDALIDALVAAGIMAGA